MAPVSSTRGSSKPRLRRGVECQVCAHPDRASVELGLANRVPARVLANRYGLEANAVWRHGRQHMTPELHAQLMTRGRALPTDLENLRVTESESLLQNLVVLRGRMYAQADIAEANCDTRGAVMIYDRIGKNVEMTARLLGEISVGTRVTNNILVTPEYHGLRLLLIEALADFPEAAARVAAKLKDFEVPLMPHAETLAEREAAAPQLEEARDVMRRSRAKKVIEGEARRVGDSE